MKKSSVENKLSDQNALFWITGQSKGGGGEGMKFLQ